MVLPKIGSFRTRIQPKNEATRTKKSSEAFLTVDQHDTALNSGSNHQPRSTKYSMQQPASQYTNAIKNGRPTTPTAMNGRPTTPTATRTRQYERTTVDKSTNYNSNSNRTLTTRSNNNSNSNRTHATRSSMMTNVPTSPRDVGSSKPQQRRQQLDEKPQSQQPNLNNSNANRKNQQQNFPNNVQQQNPKMIRKVILFLKMKAMDVERADAAIQQQFQQLQQQQQQLQQQGQQQPRPEANVQDITETTQDDSFSTTSNHSTSQHVVSTVKQRPTSSPKREKPAKQQPSTPNGEEISSTKQQQTSSPNRDKARTLKHTNDRLLRNKSNSTRAITQDSPTKEIKLPKPIVSLRRTLIEEELKQFLETHNTDVEDNDHNNTDDTDDQFITTDDTDEDNHNKNYDGDFYDSNHNNTHTTTENEVDHDDEDDDDDLNEGSYYTSNNNTLESEYDRVVDCIDTTTTDDLADFDSSDFLDDHYDEEDDDDDDDSNNTTNATDYDDDDDTDDDDEDEFGGKVYDPTAPLHDFTDLFPDYIPWGRGPGSIASSSKPGKPKSTTKTPSTKTSSNRKHVKRSSASSTCSMSVRTSNSNVTVASYIKEKNNPFSRHYVHPSEQSPSVRRKNIATRAAMMATLQQQQKQKQKQKKLNKKKLTKCNTVANSSTSSTKKMKDPVTGYRSTKAKNKTFIPPRKIEVERFIIQAPAASPSEPTATVANTTVTSTIATTATASSSSTNKETIPLRIPQLPLSEQSSKPRSNTDTTPDQQMPSSPSRRHPYDRDSQNHRYEHEHHPHYHEPHSEDAAYPKHDPYYPEGRKTPSSQHQGRSTPSSHHIHPSNDQHLQGRSTPSSHYHHPSNDQHPSYNHSRRYHNNAPEHDDARYGRRRYEYHEEDYHQRRLEPNHCDGPHPPPPSYGHHYQKYNDDFPRPTTPTSLRPTTPVNGSARATPTNLNLRAPTPVDRFHSSRNPTPYGPSIRDDEPDHYSHSVASGSGTNNNYSSRHSHDHYSQPRDPDYDGSYRQSRSSYSTTTNNSERGNRSHYHHPDDVRYTSNHRDLNNRMSDYDRDGHSYQHGYEHQRGANYHHNSQSSVSNSLVVYNSSPETNYDHRYNQHRRDINDYEDWNPNKGPPSMMGPSPHIVSPSSPYSRNRSSYESTPSANYSGGKEHSGPHMERTPSYRQSNHYTENQRLVHEPRYYDDGNKRNARHTNSHQVENDDQYYKERNEQRLGFVGTIPEGQPYSNHFHQSNRSLDTGLRQNNHSQYNHEFARTTHDGRNYPPHHRRDNSSEDFQSGFRNDDGIYNSQRREHHPPYNSISQPNDHQDYRQKYLSSNRSSMEKGSGIYSGRNESTTTMERDRYSGNYPESFDPSSLEKPYSRVVSPIHFSSFQGRETPTDRKPTQRPGSRWDEFDVKFQKEMPIDSKNNKVPIPPPYKGYPYDGNGEAPKNDQHHSKSYSTDNASVANSKRFTFTYPPALQPFNDPHEVKNQQDFGAHNSQQQQTHAHSRIDDDALFSSMGANVRRLKFDSNQLLSDTQMNIPRGPSPCLPESDCEADDVTVNTQNTSKFDSFAQDLGPDSSELQPGYSRRLYFPSETSFKSDQSSITMSGHHPQNLDTNPSRLPTNNDLTLGKEAAASRSKGSEEHLIATMRPTDASRAYDIAFDPDTLLHHSENSRNSANLVSKTPSQFRQQQSVSHDNVASAYRNSVLDKYPVTSANAQRQPHQNDHSDSRGADRSDQQQPSPQHIEICKGVYGILRDANETIKAYENGFIVYPVCLVCSLDLVSIADAEYVLCPSCKVVSPVVVDESSRKGLPNIPRRPGGGVCLGLDASRCR